MQRIQTVCIEFFLHSCTFQSEAWQVGIKKVQHPYTRGSQRLEVLQKKLASAAVLALSRNEGHFTFDTDVCDERKGCFSMQD